MACLRRYYVIDEDTKQPRPCALEEWAKWIEHGLDQIVEKTTIKTLQGVVIEVSTVFLGLDHALDEDSPPLIYETMVFGGVLDQEQNRYSTPEEAQSGHADMVHRVRNVGQTLTKERGNEPGRVF